jgi:hypothetical protein
LTCLELQNWIIKCKNYRDFIVWVQRTKLYFRISNSRTIHDLNLTCWTFFNFKTKQGVTQFYGIVVRVPDFGPRDPWFSVRNPSTADFSRLGKGVSVLDNGASRRKRALVVYCLYSAGESLYCGMLRMQHTCLTKKQYLGVWRADWVFGAPESIVNHVK